MLPQTIEQVMHTMRLLTQPAFCVAPDGTVTYNDAAAGLAPMNSLMLNPWLGDASEVYHAWSREDSLRFTVRVHGTMYSATAETLADGTLFLLASMREERTLYSPLSASGHTVRQPLTELSIVSQQLFERLDEMDDPEINKSTAQINRAIYRLTRAFRNMTDLELMDRDQFVFQPSLLDLRDFLLNLQQELVPLTAEAGKTLEIREPAKLLQIHGSSDLLERMILNLLSNAIKFGVKSDTIFLWTETLPTMVLLRMRNHCTDSDRNLLRTAFRRLEERGTVPDPKWGIGLGLPLARHIAMLHGGTLALECSEDGTVTVSVSLSRRRAGQNLLLRSPILWDSSGGMRASLVELSDVLPFSAYSNIGL